jgi:Serine/threonine protein kinase
MSKELSANTTLLHYRIISKIGAGGMGEVYLAEDTKLDRKVAIKFLNEEFSRDPDKLNRFIQEAKAASALNHPNILTVYEIGEAEGKNYIATELIDGKTLREHLSHKEPLQLNTILKIGVQVAEALSAAHQAGIIHRDIKPENIMIRRDGYAKVLDFGLAKLSEREAAAAGTASSEEATRAQINTTPGMIMGTVSYMSPEQARGNPTDARTDIWSLGVVLYEMLEGKVPFTGETFNHTIISILEKEPLRLENVPDELQRIVRKSLTKDAEMRYQSARDLLIDLKNLRRDLDIRGELERSVVPHREITGSSIDEDTRMYASDGIAATRSGQGVVTQNVTTSSSLEYAVTQAKSHKLATALVGLLLLGAISTVSYFGFFKRGGNAGQISSIAVLPFQNRSDDTDTDYLSDGLTESLIFRLSQLPGLKVSPTSSVIRYKGMDTDVAKIASELGVDSVMTGRIVKRGDNLNITVELVDTRNNKSLWGEQYDRKMSDLLATQRDIATAITQKLELKLSGSDAKGITKKFTNSSEAYQLYLKGRFYFARRSDADIRQSIELFQQAIKLDPNFALAYVGIGEAWAVMPSYPYMSPKDAVPQAKAAVAKALEIDPDLPEAHTVAGMIAATYDWDWTKAESEFKRSLDLDPNIALTHYRYAWTYLSPMGRHDEAIAEMKRAMELEPLSLVQGANFAAIYIYARQYDNALDIAKKTYDLDPSMVTGQNWMCHSYDWNGMYAESLAISENVSRTNTSLLAAKGYAYAKSGQRQKAEEVINKYKEDEKTKYIANYWLAVIHVAVGDKDAAFAELEKAYQAHDWFLQRLKVDPFMDPLRNDPRFNEMVKRLNLPQ